METFSPQGNIHGPIMPVQILKSSLSNGAKLLYSALCNYAGAADHCFPSHAKMAECIGCSISSIKNYLRELEARRLIRIRSCGCRASTYFLLRPSWLSAKAKDVSGRGSKVGYPQAKVGYINTLNKKREEKISPLPPGSSTSSNPPVKSPRGGGSFFAANEIFEKFWAAYPRREAKELARAAWHRLWRNRQLPSLETLLEALARFRASAMWNREHGRFIPQGVNWLKGRRWLDEGSPEEGRDSVTPEEKAKRELMQRLRKAQEEDRQKRDQADREMADRLRPVFDAFLARFSDGAKMRGPAWGLWSLLHDKGLILKAEQVSGENPSVMEFLRLRKREAAML